MAWTYFPLTNGDDQQLYPMVEELWVAVKERHKALGSNFWPPQNSYYESGDSFSLSGTHGNVVLTDSDKDWTTSAPALCSVSEFRWVGYVLTCPPPADNSNIVQNYDCIFDHEEPKKVVRAQITANTINTLTLNLKVDDLIAQGVISSLSELTSRTYYIIKRDGLWWSDRWPEYANSNAEWLGSVSSVVARISTPVNAEGFGGMTFHREGHDDITIIDSGPDYFIIPWQTTPPSGAYEVIVDDGTDVLYEGTVGTVKKGIYEPDDHYSNLNTWSPQKKTSWATGEWASKEIIVGGSDGRIHRETIAGNDKNVLWFNSLSYDPSGNYAIIAPGDFYVLDHQNMPIGRWYGGVTEGYWSHKPDDSGWPNNLGVIEKPIWRVEFKDAGSPEFCGPDPQYHTAFDTDVWSSIENVCSGWTGAEKCYSPNLYKSIRGLQNDVLAIGSSFVPVQNYTGASAIPNYVPARLLYDADVNKFSSTTSRVDDGEGNFNLIIGTFTGLPYSPISAHYVVLDQYGDNWIAGVATLENGVPVNLGGNHEEDKAGRTVLWSYGFTRYVPLEFRYWPTFEKKIFIPDYETKADGFGIPQVFVYYPPEVADYCCDDEEEPPEECCRDCFGVGQWVTHEGSSSYVMRNEYGFVQETGDEFQIGDVARFIGDNFADPALGGLWQEELDPDDNHWDRFYRGMHPPAMQRDHEAAKTGTATKGDLASLTDSTKNWFIDWYGDGEMRTESGTATSGSTGSLIDETKIPIDTGNGNEAACFWKLDRTVEGTGYKDFILEVDHGEDSEGPITFKTTINSIHPSTGTISFVPVDGLTVEAGDSYRIVEPSEVNRWKGRTVEVIHQDGTIDTRKITHNDATTIWFDEELSQAAVLNTNYRIKEPIYGGVYKYTADGWVPVTGSDPRGAPWRSDIRLNLPHKRKLYGSMMAGDYIHKELLNEIYRVIDRLRWTKFSIGWTSRYDGVTPELNTWQPYQQLHDIGCVDIAGGSDTITWQGTGEPITDIYGEPILDENGNPIISRGLIGCYMRVEMSESDGAAPYWFCSGTLFPTSSSISGGAAYAYGVTTSIPILMQRAVDFFAMGWLDAVDSDERDNIIGCFEIENTDCYTQTYAPWIPNFRREYRKVHTNYKYESSSTTLTYRTFKKYSTVGPNQDVRVVSDRLGNNAPVPPVDKPMDFTYFIEPPEDPVYGYGFSEWETKHFGNIAAKNTAIARWDVSGGLVKVT